MYVRNPFHMESYKSFGFQADGDAMIYEVDLVVRNNSAPRNSQFL